MKVDEIYVLESTNECCIHLVRDRLFWRAWERSAFYFVKEIRPYKVHCRFVQKTASEMVWLGFPKVGLSRLQSEAIEKGLRWIVKDENHIVISGCKKQDGFDSWKKEIMTAGAKPELKPIGEASRFDLSVASEDSLLDAKKERETAVNRAAELQLYRVMYDLCLEVVKSTAKVAKEFKFGLADKIRDDFLTMVEKVHLALNGQCSFAKKDIDAFVYGQRVKLRLLCDLRQISFKRWIFLNNQLEAMLKFSGQSSSIHESGECAVSSPVTRLQRGFS